MQPAAIDDVFVNCPFDAAYLPTFRAITFAIYACGFRLRSALEIDDGSYARLEKIMDIIGECRFGIHDLSRTDLDVETGLPRFNMPLELGLFLGAKRFDQERQGTKRALIVDIEQFRYRKFISDISGLDIKAHGQDPLIAVSIVRNWLATVSKRRISPAPKIVAAYKAFAADFPAIVTSMGFEVEDVPYIDFNYVVTDWLLTAQT